MWRRAPRHAGPSKHRAEPSGAGRGGSARRKPIRSRLRRRGCRRRRRRRQLRPSGPGRVTPVERRSAGGGGCYGRLWSVWHRDRRDGRRREPSARRVAGRRPFFRADAATMYQTASGRHARASARCPDDPAARWHANWPRAQAGLALAALACLEPAPLPVQPQIQPAATADPDATGSEL
jgi:hypothetical protein